jgi:hypothetical protein
MDWIMVANFAQAASAICAAISAIIALIEKVAQILQGQKAGKLFKLSMPLITSLFIGGLIITLLLSLFVRPILIPISSSLPKLNISSASNVNRQLTCTDQCDSVATLNITVLSFALNPTQKQTSMLISLDTQQNYTNCHFNGLSGNASDGLNFQDSAGKIYQPGGQLEPFSSFSLVQGQPLKLTATYSFLPSPGSTYTLQSTSLSCTSISTFEPVYGTAQFTF